MGRQRLELVGGLVTAVRTLTCLPFPGRDAGAPAAALVWFPVVGAALGGVMWVAVRAVAGEGWPEGAAFGLVAASVLVTRGLHLDGIADWADGFWGGFTRERTLEIMKDSRIGVFGGAALTLVLLGKWVALTALLRAGQEAWLVAAMVLSRAVQGDLAVWLPYARGEGTAGRFVSEARWWQGVAVWLVAAALVTATTWPAWPGAVAATLSAWLAGRGFGWWVWCRIGGVTGDVLGAASELVELGIFVAVVVVAPGVVG